MLRFISKILAFGFSLLVVNLPIGYFLKSYETVDLKGKSINFSQQQWEDYYQLEENIDLLVLGSSHAFRSFNPEVISNNLSQPIKTFNLGSPAQTPVTSYAVLLEVLKEHQPQLLIFDLYAMVFTEDFQLRNARFIWHAMEKDKGKESFFNNAFTLNEKILLNFFPAYIYKDYWINKLKKGLGKKYVPAPKGQYQNNGFSSSKDTVNLMELQNSNQFDAFDLHPKLFTSKNVNHLKKIG